jgi:cathepsin L
MSELILDSEWQAWKVFHNKNYKTRDEEGIRYAIWKENLEIIKRHNKVKHSFDMAMNHLGDLVSVKQVGLQLP